MGSKHNLPSPLHSAGYVADVDRLLFDLNSAFNPVLPGCQVEFNVSAVKDGYVFMSLALPEGMTRAYVALLESLGAMVRCIDVKSRHVAAQSKVHDLSIEEQNRQRVDNFKARVVALYDRFISEGCDASEGIRRTNAQLKQEGEILANYEWVKAALREAGKFRKHRKKRG